MTSLFIVVDWLQPTDFCTFHILLYPPVRIQPFFLKEKIMAGHWFQFQNKTNKSSAGQLVCKKSWSMFFEKESRCNKATNIVTDKEKKKVVCTFCLFFCSLFCEQTSQPTDYIVTSNKESVCPAVDWTNSTNPNERGRQKKKQINRMNH